MTDWRKILVAYISHVHDCEGAVHFPRYIVGGTALEVALTEDEKSSLLTAVDEALEREQIP